MNLLEDLKQLTALMPEGWQRAGWSVEILQEALISTEYSGNLYAAEGVIQKRGTVRFLAPLGTVQPKAEDFNARLGDLIVSSASLDIYRGSDEVFGTIRAKPSLELTVRFNYLGKL